MNEWPQRFCLTAPTPKCHFGPGRPLRDRRKTTTLNPRWSVARRSWLAARFAEPNMIRLLVKNGADPLFVHHSDRVLDRVPYEHRKEALTILMAAAGMGGGGTPWVQVDRAQRESLVLETVKLAIELG